MGVSGTPDMRIDAIAAAQRGRVARRQLVVAAVNDDMIRSRVRSGRLIPRHNGVYIVAPVTPIPLGDETAALLAVGEDSVLSHLTAGVVYEIVVVPIGTPIHVTTPHTRMHREGIVVHRSYTLHPVDIRIHEGLRITSVARTLLDVAEILPMRDVERAVDEALGRRLVTISEIRDVIRRNNGKKGAGILTRFIDWRAHNTGSRTKWERMAANGFRVANFPPFEQNVKYRGFSHDFLWRKQEVTLEINGSWHLTRLNSERDLTKRSQLIKAGFDPNEASNTQVEERLSEVVTHMAARLARSDETIWESGAVSDARRIRAGWEPRR